MGRQSKLIIIQVMAVLIVLVWDDFVIPLYSTKSTEGPSWRGAGAGRFELLYRARLRC